jgi:hypothetical protein
MGIVRFGCLAAMLVMGSTAVASAKEKAVCKNANAELHWIDQDRGTYECRHKTERYVLKCDAGYTFTGGQCRRESLENATSPKCSIGNWKCEKNGADQCYSKKDCEGAHKGGLSCSGLNSKTLKVDFRGNEDMCVKEEVDTKDRSVDRCPVGWEKGSLERRGDNGYEAYFCTTAL